MSSGRGGPDPSGRAMPRGPSLDGCGPCAGGSPWYRRSPSGGSGALGAGAAHGVPAGNVVAAARGLALGCGAAAAHGAGAANAVAAPLPLDAAHGAAAACGVPGTHRVAVVGGVGESPRRTFIWITCIRPVLP